MKIHVCTFQTVWIHDYMASRGWVRPSVYQGMLNGITRSVVTELMPALRRLGMGFYAYNPLAGGMLTGKHKTVADGMASGRFTGLGDEKYGEAYRARFMLPEHFAAVELITKACASESIAPADAALRWLMHHSGLAAELGDGIIVGASSVGHFEANMKSLQGTPLPSSVVTAFDEGWALCRPVVASYSRGYSGSNIA